MMTFLKRLFEALVALFAVLFGLVVLLPEIEERTPPETSSAPVVVPRPCTIPSLYQGPIPQDTLLLEGFVRMGISLPALVRTHGYFLEEGGHLIWVKAARKDLPLPPDRSLQQVVGYVQPWLRIGNRSIYAIVEVPQGVEGSAFRVAR